MENEAAEPLTLGSRDLEESAIGQLVADTEAFQNDTERFSALLTDDVVIVNIAGIRVRGREEFKRAMAAALQTHLARVLTKTELLDVSFLRPNVAIVGCVKYVSDLNEVSSPVLPARGSLTFVVIKGENGWRIALAQTTPIQI